MLDNMTEVNNLSKLYLEWHQHTCLCFAIVTAVVPTFMLSRFSRVWLFAIIWTVAHQAPLSWDSPGKNTGVGCHFLLLPWDLSDPGIAAGFPALQVDSLPLSHQGSPHTWGNIVICPQCYYNIFWTYSLHRVLQPHDLHKYLDIWTA